MRDVSPSQGLLQSAIQSQTEEAPERAKRLSPTLASSLSDILQVFSSSEPAMK